MGIFNSIITCKNCGKKLFVPYAYSKYRCKDQTDYCSECNYWLNIINNPDKNLEVLGDKCLLVYPYLRDRDKSMMLGGRGKTRYFVREDLSVIKSNDIWVIGTIPERFKQHFSRTITEITKKAYNQLKRLKRKCQAASCFDRYHCFRFNLELEKKNGAFNKIPVNWNVGDERCRYFINHKEILSDESSVSKDL